MTWKEPDQEQFRLIEEKLNSGPSTKKEDVSSKD
jgi:hypothetical protein